jgi:hypothetical protein
MIEIPCLSSDDLNWESLQFPESGPFWISFDLGLESPFFPIDEEMRFQSLGLALERFSKEIWPRFEKRIEGAILYRGALDFSPFYAWTDKQLQNFEVWKQNRPSMAEKQLKRLFCADAFVHYFQMLSHKLPDELPIHLMLDASGEGSLAEKHQLISRERFGHFCIAAKGLHHFSGNLWKGDSIVSSMEKPPVAFCFPEESKCSSELLFQIEKLFGQIETDFRVIPEAFLTEEWDGVDLLHVLKETTTPQGERKLKGFLAAGGVIQMREGE